MRLRNFFKELIDFCDVVGGAILDISDQNEIEIRKMFADAERKARTEQLNVIQKEYDIKKLKLIREAYEADVRKIVKKRKRQMRGRY